MRFFTARRLALAALVPAIFVLSVIPGCSNGGEGERCGDPPELGGNVSNNSDCGSGLVCTLVAGQTVGRCCYPDHVSDSRCLKSNGTSATNPTSGGGPSAEAGPSNGDAGSSGVGGAPSMTVELAGAAGAAGAH
jgi:hypothetical protein